MKPLGFGGFVDGCENFLGDIPGIGNLFRSTSKEKARTELLVLITPYVLVTPEDAEAETRRIFEGV